MNKSSFAGVVCLLSVGVFAEPRIILDSDRLDYVTFPQDQTEKLNSGWEMDGAAFVRPFNRQTAGVVRYAAVFKLPADVSAELRFENAKGDALKSERIAGGREAPVSGAFDQDGSLARVRLVPSKPVAPKGLLVRPFRATVGWATDVDFTCVPRGTLPAGWRGEKAKAVDLPYQGCAGGGRDRPASDAVLEIAPGGFVDPCADKALLTGEYAFEFDALVDADTKFAAAGVDVRTLYRFTPGIWYHFRFEVSGALAKVRLNGRVIAEGVKVDAPAIRNLSQTAKLLVDDVKAFALVSPADYPSAPTRAKGEEKWDVIMNICSLWYNGRHAGWRCIERAGGPRPVLGYYDEGLPETADWEIKYMVDHGVDVQAFCWYPESHDGPIRHPRYEYQLRDGFKNARYSDRMKYCLIWEIQNAGRPHSLEAWKKNYVPYLIEHHFKDPRYYAPDGKPMLAVFGGWNFPQETAFGSAATTKAAFDYLEAELKKLGFKGLVTVSSNWHDGRENLAACGFSARCAYNYGTEGWKVETQKTRNRERAAIPGAFVLPTVSVGFNSRPWHGVAYPMMSPSDLVKSFAWVRDEFMPGQKHAEPWQARAVWLSTWNEYGEGTYMMPTDDALGFGYLDAVRAVFTDEAPDPKLNVVPTKEQRERICHLYPQRQPEDGAAAPVEEPPEVAAARGHADYYTALPEGERAAAEKRVVECAMRALADLEMIPPRIIANDVPDRYRRARLDFAMNGGAAVTPGGRVWNCWMAGGDNQKAHVVGAWSDDGGRTWSDVKFVVDPHFPGDRVGFAHVVRNSLIANLWVLDDGKLRLTVFQSLDNWIGRGGTWEFVCANPDADMPVWSAPRYLFPGSVHNKPTRLKDGTWLYPNDFEPYGAEWHPELEPHMGCGVYALKNGAVAKRGGFVRPEGTRRGGQRHWAEHAIVERKDGSLWMLMRTALGLQESFSADAGMTWTAPKPTTHLKNCIARFSLIKLASGNMLFVKNGERVDVATCGDQPANGPRRTLSAFVSADDGKTWKGPLVLDSRDEVAYPDAFQFPDGSIGVTYDHLRERAGLAEICFARFREADVFAGRLVSPDAFLP